MAEQINIDPEVRSLAEFIKAKFNPQKIVLFGSYAYGQPQEGSDIDFLVIMQTSQKFYKQSSIIRLMLDEEFGVFRPLDIIVRTPEFIKKRVEEGDIFIRSILEKGKEL